MDHSNETTGAAKAAASESKAPSVWAIGGGKGGVGKSIVTSSIGFSLSARGGRVAVVDADLGGANLHTLLGVPRPKHTISDFLLGRIPHLADAMSETSIRNLWLVSGSRAFLDAANPKHAQKQKLLRHLRRLNFDHVLVDLGAGSSYNVLDLFNAADRRIMVVSPEPTSVENTYHFVKAAFFRSLRQVPNDKEDRTILADVTKEARRESLSPTALIDLVVRRAPGLGGRLRSAARGFSPMLLVNRVDTAEDRTIGYEMAAAARRHLGAHVRYVGALVQDAAVPSAVAKQKAVLQLFPGCAFARSLEEAVGRMLGGERLSEADAPLSWRVRRTTPSVSTHGVSETGDVQTPKLSRRAAPERPQAPEVPVNDLENPGEALRRRREQLGFTLSQMAEKTRLRCLEALESESLGDLPAAPYVLAQVREYARALRFPSPDRVASIYVDRVMNRPQPGPQRGLLARLRGDNDPLTRRRTG
jgi:flagellar biosynthesis protein FlhG